MGKNKNVKAVKSKNKNKKTSVNSARFITNNIPYKTCFEEMGMIQIEGNKYSITYAVEAPNELVNEKYISDIAYDRMENILTSLKGFDFRFTIRNSVIPVDEYLKSIQLSADCEPAVNDFIEAYNDTLKENVSIGHNNFKMALYLTLITTAKNDTEALNKFKSVDDIVVENVKALYSYNARLLTLSERLEILFNAYNPDENGAKFGDKVNWDGNGFSIASMKKMKMSTKDVISPVFYQAKERNYMCIGNKFVRMFFINTIPKQITDNLLSDIISVSSNSILSINYTPIDVDLGFSASARLVKQNTEIKNVMVRDTIADRKNKRVDKKEISISNNENEYFNKSALNIFTDAKAKEQPVYLTSIIIGLYSDSLEELERDTELLRISVNKYNCLIKVCDLQQNEAFQSVLPLGSMKIDVNRVFPLERLSKLLPVNIQSLFEEKVTLQGLNEINDNFVLTDRRNYPVGLISGMKGSGKSFAMKREVMNTLMSNKDDIVVIVNRNKYNAKRELMHNPYENLVNTLGGKVVNSFNTDLFTYDESYGLTTDNSVFKEMFLESFIVFRLGLHKKVSMTSTEIEAIKDELLKECTDLSKYTSYTEATDYANANPEQFKLFLAALKGFTPTDEYPNFVENRVNLVNFNTASELLMIMDYLWNVAVVMKKSNVNVWIYVDDIDDYMYSTHTSDYLISLMDKCEKIKVPLTMINEDGARIASHSTAKIEFDYFLDKVDYFKLLTQGVIERKQYINKLNIPQSLVPYITDREAGEGVLITPSANISFNDRFDDETNVFYKKLK